MSQHKGFQLLPPADVEDVDVGSRADVVGEAAQGVSGVHEPRDDGGGGEFVGVVHGDGEALESGGLEDGLGDEDLEAVGGDVAVEGGVGGVEGEREEVFAVGFAPFSAGRGGDDDVAGAAEAGENVSDDFDGEMVHDDGSRS